MAEITIPENKETGGASSSCMNCARSICRGIQNSPCNRLFESDAWQIFVWAIRILLIASSSAVIHYRSEFEGIPEVITAYCTGVIMCAIFSIIPRGGYLMFDYLYGSGSFRTQSEGKLVEVSGGGHSAKNNEKTSIPTWYSPQMIEKIRKIASKQIPAGLATKEQVASYDSDPSTSSGGRFPVALECDVYRPGASGYIFEVCMKVVPVDFHRADESSESSTYADLVSGASDEPLQQPGPSGLGGNLPPIEH